MICFTSEVKRTAYSPVQSVVLCASKPCVASQHPMDVAAVLFARAQAHAARCKSWSIYATPETRQQLRRCIRYYFQMCFEATCATHCCLPLVCCFVTDSLLNAPFACRPTLHNPEPLARPDAVGVQGYAIILSTTHANSNDTKTLLVPVFYNL